MHCTLSDCHGKYNKSVVSSVSHIMTKIRTFLLNQNGTFKAGVSNMWPARAFCVARDALREFSDNQHLCYLVYSPVFESAWLASKQVPFDEK